MNIPAGYTNPFGDQAFIAVNIVGSTWCRTAFKPGSANSPLCSRNCAKIM